MHQSRYDVPPLPIAELATIRFESNYHDEPFILAGNVHGRCALSATALRHAHDFVPAHHAALRATITPCGVVRSASIDGVMVQERIAVLLDPLAVVSQWTSDRDVVLDLGDHGRHHLRAGATLTFGPDLDAVAIDRAFRAACNLAARAAQHGLVVRGAGPISNALAWASARLALVDRPIAELPLALAALATGRARQVRDALPDLPPALLPLLAARYAAATGDLNTIIALRRHIAAAALELSEDGEDRARLVDQSAAVLRAITRLAGLTELERTATDIGDPAWAAQLRAGARHLRQPIEPLVTDPAALALRAALRLGSDSGQDPATHDVALHTLQAWAALEHGSLAAGLAAADRSLAEYTRPTRGAWPATFGAPDFSQSATALFVCMAVYGCFGIEPDAPRHRIALRPRLPRHPEPMSVRGIACGDAVCRLDLDTEQDAVVLTITQEAGAIPVTAIVEPLVAGRVHSVLIDGRDAALDRRAVGTGTVVPVQLVLDQARTVTLRWEPKKRSRPPRRATP